MMTVRVQHLKSFINLAGLLFLSLRGTPIDEDGFVDVDDIGRSDNPDNRLLCLTNETNCCGNDQPGGAQGNWFFPNGTTISTLSNNIGSVHFFSRNRGQGVIRLHRYNNPSERGRFRCGVLGDTTYVNICECMHACSNIKMVADYHIHPL